MLRDLMPASAVRPSLFNPAGDTQHQLDKATGSLNKANGRFVREMVFITTAGLTRAWKVRAENGTPFYTIRWSELPIAKARWADFPVG